MVNLRPLDSHYLVDKIVDYAKSELYPGSKKEEAIGANLVRIAEEIEGIYPDGDVSFTMIKSHIKRDPIFSIGKYKSETLEELKYLWEDIQ